MVTLEAQQKILDAVCDFTNDNLKNKTLWKKTYDMGNLSDNISIIIGKQNTTEAEDKRWVWQEAKIANALEFELSVVNGIMLKDIFNENIDSIFSNNNSPLFNGMETTEIEQVKNQLKEVINEKIDVVPKTESARNFKDMVQAQYQNIISKDGNKDALRSEFISQFLNPANKVVKAINDSHKKSRQNNNIPQLLNFNLEEMRFNASLDGNETETEMMRGLTENLNDYASEVDIINHSVRNATMEIKRNSEVIPTDFLNHFKEHTATPEEIQWAARIFDNAYNNIDPDFKYFLIDDKPMFNHTVLPQNNEWEKAKVVAEALSGKKIELMDPKTHNKDLFNPQIIDSRRENRSVFEWLVDFFKDLFSIGLKEKDQIMRIQNRSADNEKSYSGAYFDMKTLDKEGNSVKSRERITFDQLSPTSAVTHAAYQIKKEMPTLNKSFSKGK